MATKRQHAHQVRFKAASRYCTHNRGPREKYTTCMSKQLGGLGGAGKKRGKRRKGRKGRK